MLNNYIYISGYIAHVASKHHESLSTASPVITTIQAISKPQQPDIIHADEDPPLITRLIKESLERELTISKSTPNSSGSQTTTITPVEKPNDNHKRTIKQAKVPIPRSMFSPANIELVASSSQTNVTNPKG